MLVSFVLFGIGAEVLEVRLEGCELLTGGSSTYLVRRHVHGLERNWDTHGSYLISA